MNRPTEELRDVLKGHVEMQDIEALNDIVLAVLDVVDENIKVYEDQLENPGVSRRDRHGLYVRQQISNELWEAIEEAPHRKYIQQKKEGASA